MAADPEAGRSEWGAEFRADISALLDDAVIDDAVSHARPLELPPRGSRHYYAFTDASAGRHDAFTLCIGHLEDETFVVDVFRGRLAPFDDPRAVAREYAALARDYGCNKIVGDDFADEWVASAFATRAPGTRPRRWSSRRCIWRHCPPSIVAPSPSPTTTGCCVNCAT